MQEEVQKLPTTNEAGDASDEDTPSGDGDLPEGYRRKLRPRTSVAMIRRRRLVEPPRHGGSTRTRRAMTRGGAKAKDSWRTRGGQGRGTTAAISSI